MDPHPTPFPGKTRPSKPKNNRKTTGSLKTITKEPPISRQKRVFGTARSTNIPTKTITEEPINKIPIGVPQKQPKPSQLTPPTATNIATNPTTESSNKTITEKPIIKIPIAVSQKQPKPSQFTPTTTTNVATNPTTESPNKTITENPIIKTPSGVPKKQPKPSQLTPITTTNVATNPTTESSKQGSPEKPKPKLKKKSVCFQKQSSKNQDNVVQEERVVAPKTPVASPSLNKAKIVGTPYYTAQSCSNCRFDRLETASYWLGQIKLAESVGKHFVSAAFFRLAFESKAEPMRNLRIELKRYMARHGYLSALTEWRDCSLTYGLLLEDEKNAEGKNLGIGEAGTSKTTCGDIDQDQKELKEQSLEQPKTQSS